jgi:hypothetical protein
MTPILRRFNQAIEKHEDQQKLGRILLETGTPSTTVARATLPGDTRRLRGIPVAGGACGTSPGTDPLQHVLHLRTIH